MVTQRHWLCEICGEQLPAPHRADKRFCSSKCRKAWQRKKESVDETFNSAMGQLRVMRSLMTGYGQLTPQLEANLKLLKDEVGNMLYLISINYSPKKKKR